MTTEQQVETQVEQEWRVFGSVTRANDTIQIKDGDADPETKKMNEPLITLQGPVYNPIRYGDKFVQFIDGVFATQDPECIAWCEANYPTVVDLNDPTAEEIIALDRVRTPREDYEPEGGAAITNIINGVRDRMQKAIDDAVAKAKAEWEAQGVTTAVVEPLTEPANNPTEPEPDESPEEEEGDGDEDESAQQSQKFTFGA